MPYTIKQSPSDFTVREITILKPAKEGPYSYFLLKKTNMNTMDELKEIAGFLRIPLKDMSFAGTKDKVAITEQYISIRGGHEKRLEGFRNDRIELKFIGRGNSPLSLGDLQGNEFEIIVREAKKEPKQLDRFINYFGEQRFSENNAEIGKDIFKGKFEKAIRLIDDPAVNDYLSKNRKDYVGALKQVPKKILTLYTNSYQSSLWNRAVDGYLSQNPKCRKDAKNMSFPILGFGTEFDDRKKEEICKRIMKEENISQRDFIIKNMPELSSEGNEREVFAEIKGMKIEKIDDRTYRLRFFLPKGCYATELIRQMFS